MATIAELAVKVGADVKDFEKNMTNVQDKTKKIGESVGKTGKSMTAWVTGPIVAASVGILGLAKSTGDYADSVLDLADQTAMSTDSIQEWQAVSAQAGVSTDAVTTASKKLTKSMSTMSTGTGKQAEALENLGISYKDLEQASPDERMEMLTQALAGVEDPALRAQYGTDLLGGAYNDLAPIVSMSADEIENIKTKAHESGAVMSGEALNDANEFRKGMEDLKQEFLGAGRSIATDFMPILTDDVAPFVSGTIVPLIRDFSGRLSDLIGWFKGLSPEMQKSIGIAVGLAAALGPVLIVGGKIITTISTLIPIVKGLSTALMFLSANPIGLVITGIAALVAGGVLLYKNWDKVKEFGVKAWQGLQQGIKIAANGIISYPNAILGAYESMINGIGSAINKIPSINIPDWVPGFGGKSFGLPTIPRVSLPRIPQLATGTNYVPKDMLAFIHEGEAVVPKKYNPSANGGDDPSSSGERQIIIQHMEVRDDYDIKRISRELHQLDQMAKRRGV
ncbi:hypothetical protein BTR23_07475 [Alkalihalophilus pseudofirmus]|nr:hypothetical protein BTR23_07475 [Alkalihalophilus pseudofirmus]